MWSFIATILSLIVGIFTKPKDAATQVVITANEGAKVQAAVARQTQASTIKEISSVQKDTDATVARIRASSGMLDTASAVQSAIDAANKEPGADH